jgi:plasmid stabilization system protein ParE
VNSRLLDEATAELRESAHWYNVKRDSLGDEFLDAFERALDIIEAHPHRFTRIPTEDEQREVRRCVLKRFPFLIAYEILADEILVVAIAHSKRKPKYWEDRL